MNKDEYTAKLSEMGYNSTLESGVIIITVADEKTAKKANKAVKEMGYDASYGIRVEGKTENERDNI